MLRFCLMIVLLVLMFGLYDSFAHGGMKMRSLAVSFGLNAQAGASVNPDPAVSSETNDLYDNALN